MPDKALPTHRKKRNRPPKGSLPVVDWDRFLSYVKELARYRKVDFVSEESETRILAGLALLFWLRKELLERAMYDHWEERRRNAELLLNLRQKVIDAVNNLKGEEAWIQTRFEVYGTGRLTAQEIGVGSIDYVLNLDRLGKIFQELEPTLTQLIEIRKPLVSDDQNLFLHLMKSEIKYQYRLWHREDIPEVAINRQIEILVEAWRLSLGIQKEVIDIRDVGRRIDRFRDRNEEVAASIESNPLKYILLFLDTSPDTCPSGGPKR